MAATWSLLCLRYVFMFLCFGFHVWSTVFFLLHPPLNLRKRLLRLPDPHSPPFSSFRFRNPIPISLRAAGSWDPHLSAPLERSSSVYQPPPSPADASRSYFLISPTPSRCCCPKTHLPSQPSCHVSLQRFGEAVGTLRSPNQPASPGISLPFP